MNHDGAWGDMLDAAWGLMGSGAIIALIGPRGTGKTGMAAELVARTVASLWGSNENPARYLTAMELFLDVRTAMKSEGEKSVIDTLCRFPLLVIDEIQERGETPWEDRVLTHVIDRRYGAMLDTVLIGNLRPEDIQPSLGASIASRIQEAGRVFKVTENNWRVMATKPLGASVPNNAPAIPLKP